MCASLQLSWNCSAHICWHHIWTRCGRTLSLRVCAVRPSSLLPSSVCRLTSSAVCLCAFQGKKTLTARVRAYLCTLSHFVLRALILSDLVWASHLILHLLQTAHSRTETCFPSGAHLLQGGKSIFFASDLQMRVWSSGGYNTKPAALRMQCQSYQVNSFVTMICGGNRFLIGNELLGKAAPHRINACSRSRA